ncbi:MAG: Transposase like protein [Firmicutes bacterium]|nr:Transposase like protein [Bacillota bacterium]
MPRQARKKSESGIYHLMVRGINKQSIFEEDDDRQRFLQTLGHYKMLSNYLLYGYCLMDNHVHLLIKETNEPLAQVVKRISSSYVHWYNQKYERCGHLFQERFKSEAVETEEYFLTVLRYIHQNPIKAGIIPAFGEYLWSSYHEYVKNPRITDVEFALSIFSNDKTDAINRFKKYTNEMNSDKCLDYAEKDTIADKILIEYLDELDIASIPELHKLTRGQRDDVIRQLKKIEGITLRQVARVTGIPKSTIERI